MKTKLTLLLLLAFLPLISSAGLSIVGTSSFEVNKTIGIDSNIAIQIKNDEPFDFYNITFEDNDYIEIDKISKISSGETYNVTAEIIAEEDFVGELKLIGYYSAQLGASNETYIVKVDFDDGLDVCDRTLIQGDSVKWFNLVMGEVVLRNAETGNDVHTIGKFNSPTENYTMLFDSPQVFEYYFLRGGFQFTDTCTLTILDDSGYINNPDYDTSINLNINVEYEPTNLSITTTQNNYSMDFFSTQDGIISITNNGNKIAKNIHLGGQWFDFNTNDFDLEPGYTKNVGYSIAPINAIYTTNQTNWTYEVNMTIEGNFPTLNEEFIIFVEYAEIGDTYSGNITEFEEKLKTYFEILESACNEESYKDSDACKDLDSRTIYKVVNSSTINATFTEEQVYEMFKTIFGFTDDFTSFQNYIKEFNLNTTQDLSKLSNETSSIKENQEVTEKKLNSISGGNAFLGISILFLAIASLVFYLIMKRKKQLKRKKMEGYH